MQDSNAGPVRAVRVVYGTGRQDSRARMQELLENINAGLFLVLAVLALARTRSPQNTGAWWFFATFAALALISGTNLVGIEDPPEWIRRILVMLIAAIPLFLARFVESFVGRTHTGRLAVVLAALLIVWTALIPVPEDGRQVPVLYVTGFLVDWVLVLGMVAYHFMQRHAGAPGVARRRARLLGFGAVGLAGGLVAAVAADFVRVAGAQLEVVAQLVVGLAAVSFLLGFSPPRWLRQTWQMREAERARQASVDALGAADRGELLNAVLPAIGQVVGARRVELRDRNDGRIAAQWSITDAGTADVLSPVPAAGEADVSDVDSQAEMRIETGYGEVRIERAGFAPHFGDEEAGLARSLAAVMALGLTRLEYLERQQEEAQRWREISELKDDFIAMVAHDLRSPLSVVSGFSDMLVEIGDGVTEEQRQEYLSIISRNTHRVARFVEDVLQVARMESGRFEYSFAPTNVAEVIAGAADESRAGVAAAHTLIVDTDELGDRLIHADRERLWQVLVNLVSNAAKYSEPGTTITVRAWHEDGHVHIAVSDEGPGIPEPDQDRAFEKFTRLSSDDSRTVPNGTGMGLYICRELIRGQGGDITIASEIGHGATFTCTLPIEGQPQGGTS